MTMQSTVCFVFDLQNTNQANPFLKCGFDIQAYSA